MEGAAMLIEEQFPGIPAPVDAAVVHDGFVLFFKGNLQYKYNTDLKSVVSTSPTNELLDCLKDDDNETK